MINQNIIQNRISFAPPWKSSYRIDPNFPHQLVNEDGDHIFILNKTEWHYFNCLCPKERLRIANEQGVNVIRVAFEGDLYSKAVPYDAWPWGGTRKKPRFDCYDESYWDRVEDRIRLAGESGIGINFTIYTHLKPEDKDISKHRATWKKIIERYARYTNILLWEIQNEYLGNPKFQDAAGSFFAQNDPYNRPVGTSDGTTDDAAWPARDWVGIAINHSCTSSTERHPLDTWYLAVARNTRSHGLPAFCNESGRELRHKNDDPHQRRKQGWLWAAAGCFWTYHSYEGCEGIDDLEYRGPGEEFLKPFADFFRSADFWRLNPCFTLVNSLSGKIISASLASACRQQSIIYLCTKNGGESSGKIDLKLRLPNGEYEATTFNPSTGLEVCRHRIKSDGLSKNVSLTIAEFTDDRVIRIDLLYQGEKKIMEGTT